MAKIIKGVWPERSKDRDPATPEGGSKKEFENAIIGRQRKAEADFCLSGLVSWLACFRCGETGADSRGSHLLGPQLRQRDWPEQRQFSSDRPGKEGPVAQARWGREERAPLFLGKWQGGHELSVRVGRVPRGPRRGQRCNTSGEWES